jgi:hypothetical protein
MPIRLVLLAALLVLSNGCFGRTNMVSATQHLTIAPVTAGGFYSGWSGTTFSQSIPANKQVRLVSVTATSSTGEFTWASSLKGAAQPDMSELIVAKSSFEGAKGTTDIDVVDTGDLRSLFPDGNSFRLYWEFEYAPTLTQAYPDGVTVAVTYTIEVE